MISVAPNPLAEFSVSSQTLNMPNPIVILNNQSSKDCSLIWDFGDSSPRVLNEYEPSHEFKAPGNYCIVLHTENIQGCTDSAEVCVTVQPEMTMFVPSSFTPNSDGKNDYFEPVGYACTQIEILIYNRWGNKVFSQSGSQNVRWSGEGFPDGVYIYDILVHDVNAQPKRLQGTVTLIR